MVNLSFKLFHAGDMRHLGVTTSSNRSNEAVKVSKGRVVVDKPAAFVILLEALDFDAKLCLFIQVVGFPDLFDLLDDLLAIGIAALPFDGGMEAVHEGVNLEARCVIDSLHKSVS